MEDTSQQRGGADAWGATHHDDRDSDLYSIFEAALAAVKEKLSKGDYAAVTSEAKALADWAKEVATRTRSQGYLPRVFTTPDQSAMSSPVPGPTPPAAVWTITTFDFGSTKIACPRSPRSTN